jgi:phosphatidylserine decarboxylase
VGRGDGNQNFYERIYAQPIKLARGDEVAFFKLGSTVVLIFESPEFEWTIQPGQKIKLNETIGRVVSNKKN